MSVKKMIELYVKHNASEEAWNLLYSMTCFGLIRRSNWNRFWRKCAGWYSEGGHVYDDCGKRVEL